MPRRPTGVWIVCGYLFATQLTSLVGIAFAFLAPDPDTAWAASYYRELPWWVVVYLVANGLFWVGAAVAIFQLRSIAFPLFLVAALFGFANLIWQAVAPWTAHAPLDQSVAQPVQAIGHAISAGILVALVGYVWHLKSKNVLS